MNQPGDTSIGGSPAFPSTVWHVLDDIRNKRAADPEGAMAQIVTRYWKPVYAFIRLGWKQGNEDAKDLTQEFFIFLMEEKTLQTVDPARGRFRNFLKTVLRNFLAGEHRKSNRVKRGGGTRRISLNFPEADLEISAAASSNPEEGFDKEWARSLVEEVSAETAATLKAAGHEAHWLILEAHDFADGEPPSYQDLAAKHGLTEAQVKHILQETRRRMRNSIILKIREYALDEDEVWEELRYMMGLWGKA